MRGQFRSVYWPLEGSISNQYYPVSQREARFLRVHIMEAGRFVLLHAVGTIDAGTTPDLSAALQPFRRRSHRLVLDLREVAHVESGGPELLMAVADELNAVGGQLRLIAQPGSEVERTLRTGGLDQRVPVFHTVPEALAGRIS